MLVFDFEPGVTEECCARTAQGWYWSREQRADLLGEVPGPFEPIERDVGTAVAAVSALYEGGCRDARVMGWTQEQARMEIADRRRREIWAVRRGGARLELKRPRRFRQ